MISRARPRFFNSISSSASRMPAIEALDLAVRLGVIRVDPDVLELEKSRTSSLKSLVVNWLPLSVTISGLAPAFFSPG